ncbi:MAG TPA: amidohydrolase family protein [Acidimicrobiales bacterium]|nr:amidohydrolase family protein [Acidimicrobiales bacterium]
MHDLVIRGGSLVDGSGAPPRRADVAVTGDRIAEVGDTVGPGRREVDAEGAVVTPGWVDMHTHYDAQATWDPELSPSGWHGVTTVVMGNCGVGFAPAAPDRRDWLIRLMEGVEDIPGAALTEGIEWEWESFEEYLDALDRRRWVADVGTQVPHGALRAYVMGDRGAANEPAAAEDLAAMERITTGALRAGALGVSTSRTPLHRSADGELVPGTHAGEDEVMALGDALRAAGHGVFQGALHHPDVPASFGWMRRLAQRSGRPVTFNLQQTDAAPDLWRDVAGLLDRAQEDGIGVYGQVHGRPVGLLMGWSATIHPFSTSAGWGPVAFLPPAERVQALRRPEVRNGILGGEAADMGDFVRSLTTSWHKMFPFRGETDYEPPPEASVAAVAEREGRPPAEVAFDVLMEDDGQGLLYFPLFNYSDGTLDPLWELHQHPRTRMGLADGGAHVGSICDGSTPSFMLAFWARDRVRGPHLPLELIVHRQTRSTALHYGLADRGLVAPGLRADLNVVDLERLAVDPPRMAWDLPTGARRFVQGSRGYRLTTCAGTVVREDDELTGAHPGRLLRGPQTAA